LPELLRAEAQSGIGKSHKAVIMIFLPGGPSHQDMFDLKQDAPSEIRGEFKPINTKVPGIQICEHMPRIAAVMDKLTVIRSMVGAKDNHDAFQCMTGHLTSPQPPGGWPSLGSVVSKLQGPVDKAVPSFIGLAPKMGHMEWADPASPVSRHRPCAVQARWRGQGRHGPQRRHARPPGGPQDVADRV
jgi:hypothetical protein